MADKGRDHGYQVGGEKVGVIGGVCSSYEVA